MFFAPWIAQLVVDRHGSAAWAFIGNGFVGGNTLRAKRTKRI